MRSLGDLVRLNHDCLVPMKLLISSGVEHCDQSYKASMSENYASRVVLTSKLLILTALDF